MTYDRCLRSILSMVVVLYTRDNYIRYVNRNIYGVYAKHPVVNIIPVRKINSPLKFTFIKIRTVCREV